MAEITEIKPGVIITGIGNSPVVVIAAQNYGGSLIITYKDAEGTLGSNVFSPAQIDKLEVTSDQLRWTFKADGNDMRLVSEAYRIHLAHLFDPYLAVHTSNVQPLPHQISAVYGEMLPRIPLRYVLADDPGAGKTIMTGLYIKELIARGDLERCLIVCPGNLAEQWQDELYTKFNLRFEIFTNDKLDSAVTGNAFQEVHYGIARMDKLARDDKLQQKLKSVDYDLIVVDEAHKMSATISLFGGEVHYTKRYQLGKVLSGITRNFLLLTATPHNGKPGDFQLFMALIDPDRFEGQVRNTGSKIDVSDCMRRLVKEDLLKFDGRHLFPKRESFTVNYSLSPAEAELYEDVTQYVNNEFNRAEKLEKGRKNTVGFALTVLQRRLASSPEAIYQSLRRRRIRLEEILKDMKQKKSDFVAYQNLRNDYIDDFDDDDEYDDDHQEEIADQITASRTIEEMEAEIQTLRNLEEEANHVRYSGHDRKWEQLSQLLQETKEMFDSNGNREKIIIFTEHKDTLRYLELKVRSLLGSKESVISIYGGMNRDERKNAEALFKQDKDVLVMIATDAASEGINLQRAHLMINYDLPWNPNRLEQRFGRIHRIGQTETCYLWNLVANETREGKVWERLFKKLDEERAALGRKVFDVLGKLTFNDEPLRDLMIEAIRADDTPENRDYLNKVVDNSLDRKKLEDLIADHGLAHDVLSTNDVMLIREDMERMEAHKLQPHFIESFFMEAFSKLGGEIRKREHNRYEIYRVPNYVKRHQKSDGYEQPVLDKYERICFDQNDCNIQGKPIADLICPGHPLMDATVAAIMDRYGPLLQQGSVYINENDPSDKPYFLSYIVDSIEDGTPVNNGKKNIISKQFHYVEMFEDGSAKNGGYAPYLDYRGATEHELAVITPYIHDQAWLSRNLEDQAIGYAINTILPPHFDQVSSRRTAVVKKAKREVKKRLDSEINYWDRRADELKQKEKEGNINAKLNSQMAKRKADELANREAKRLTELDAEMQVHSLPPVIAGGAIVIPAGLLLKLDPTNDIINKGVDFFGSGDRMAMEQKGIEIIMNIEKSLGNTPVDRRKDNCGYDVESKIPDPENHERSLRMIELKTRQEGAETITISRNEIATCIDAGESWILAIVFIDGDEHRVYYVQHPFTENLSFAQVSANYSINDILKTGNIIYQE